MQHVIRSSANFCLKIDAHSQTLFSFNLFFGCFGSLLLCTGFLQLRRAKTTLCCDAWASYCSGFACCRAQSLGAWTSVVAIRGLSSCGTQALERVGFSSCGAWAQQLCLMGSVVVAHGLQIAGSVVVAHGLSCSAACGIFLDQGSNLCPLHWQVDSFFKFYYLIIFYFLTSLLEYNCFTMVCQFLLYNKVNQLYTYIYPHISSLQIGRAHV